jgi:transcriptional regulator with XRE-family HTH domain
MRYLRQKYNIPIQELAMYSEVSAQRLSQVELSEKPPTGNMDRLVEAAFLSYVRQRREELSRLADDLARYGKCLTEQVNETGESL